jgi:hypothetical protein
MATHGVIPSSTPPGPPFLNPFFHSRNHQPLNPTPRHSFPSKPPPGQSPPSLGRAAGRRPSCVVWQRRAPARPDAPGKFRHVLHGLAGARRPPGRHSKFHQRPGTVSKFIAIQFKCNHIPSRPATPACKPCCATHPPLVFTCARPLHSALRIALIS